MASYSIRDLEKLSGIKAHTIRIWEQRYSIIEPKRTVTNIRFYTDDDLQFVLNVAFLNKNGIRISKISKMSREEVGKKVSSISSDNLEYTNQQHALTMAMIELNELKFHQIIDSSIAKDGFFHTLSSLLVPFLEKLSLLWLTGSISTVHEQFINHLIKHKIANNLDKLPEIDAQEASYKPRVLIFEPQSNDNEVLLNVVNFLFRYQGCQTMYLGSGISLKDISIAVDIFQPNCLFTSISDNQPKSNPQDFIYKLSREYEHLQILSITGTLLKPVISTDNVVIFEEFGDFFEFLEEI